MSDGVDSTVAAGIAVRPSRRWSLTHWLSSILTARVAIELAVLITLFAVLSIPVWRHMGWNFPLGREWYFRRHVFGALPMIYGTVAVAAVAMIVAIPLSLGTAIFLAEYLPLRFRLPLKLAIELLAGIPSVVYGLLGILFLRNYVYTALRWAGFEPLTGDTLLTAGLLLAIMLLPTLVTLFDDALRGVPAAQRLAARGLGLSKAQVVVSVSLPQAWRGLLAAALLALGRALGETIAVFLVVGRQDNRLPNHLFSLDALLSAGQTISSKLGGAETNIAYGDPLHWAAIIGIGLLLMAMVLLVTIVGARLQHSTESAKTENAEHHNAPPAGRENRSRNRSSHHAFTLLPTDILHAAMRRAGRGLPIIAAVCTAIVFATMTCIVSAILIRGLPAISWQFLTEQIALVGASGGIFYNLVGTGILIITAAAVAAPTAVGVALTQTTYLPSERSRHALLLLLYTLNGVPAILIGIFGLIVFVNYLGWGKSWLAGGLLLGMMILPTVAISLIERIGAIPPKYLEAARGLGLSRSQVIRAVVLPQSVGGLMTGLLLGVARAAGETAPIMFTATIFAGATFPEAITESPVLSLPYHIFTLAQDSFDPNVAGKLWGSAAVLLILVTTLSFASLLGRLKMHEEAGHV